MREQNFISEGELEACVEKSFDELQKREWPCDIHILDFIQDNYRYRQIFYAPNHPAPNVLLEITQRILKFMGVSDMTFNNYDLLLSDGFALHGQDVPVYPKVKAMFGWSDGDCLNEYNANTGVSGFRGDYITFLQEYVRRCWADKLRPE